MKIKCFLMLSLFACSALWITTAQADEPTLKFTADGTFKILAFADTHLGPECDSLTARLLEKVIEIEKPNFIIVNGDVTTGDPGPKVEDLQKAIDQMGHLLAAKK
ncbi:metallophosphoesterase, partial [candidate division KSB1 bacterium]|nr:metallophosphoesterase [candidate division KSB1 bacterium]